ncbi:pyridoxamine 5'-phosphate oxidase family protein [Stakelama sp. CBK3Z-3]|uniref:Pyridoxamine 5'-phosphate oxidase family protein n=1 Tax=Stakelama flava TaxID=2860338 RepID=A0ABS6XN96_9SPHN|nr:pyridoxamine 5'-phosphate oxidase family protein [Stakelama flava]MBW4331679.1 pyridoxamine 5'-phosphate oxidase family protein [Stakelama flava]
MADKKTAEQVKHDFWKKLADSPFVMLGLKDNQHSEPLTAQLDKDQVDTIYFFVAKDNRAARGGPAMVQFVSKGHDFFACISGTAKLSDEPGMIDKLWSKQVEAWFPGGKNDPNLALLRFDIGTAEMWETDISLGGKLKMLFGGTIKSDEMGEHEMVATTREGTSA